MNVAPLLLARLLDYPADELQLALPELRAVLPGSGFSAEVTAGLNAHLDWLATTDWLTVQARWLDCCDRGRRHSLYLFEHVHGESRDRGGAMIDLLEFYKSRGLELAPGELPDYLPVVLEFVASRPAEEARAFLGELAHLAQQIHAAHAKSDSPWQAALAGVLTLTDTPALAPSTAPAVPEDDVDQVWAEPPLTFAGAACPVAATCATGRKG